MCLGSLESVWMGNRSGNENAVVYFTKRSRFRVPLVSLHSLQFALQIDICWYISILDGILLLRAIPWSNKEMKFIKKKKKKKKSRDFCLEINGQFLQNKRFLNEIHPPWISDKVGFTIIRSNLWIGIVKLLEWNSLHDFSQFPPTFFSFV